MNTRFNCLNKRLGCNNFAHEHRGLCDECSEKLSSLFTYRSDRLFVFNTFIECVDNARFGDDDSVALFDDMPAWSLARIEQKTAQTLERDRFGCYVLNIACWQDDYLYFYMPARDDGDAGGVYADALAKLMTTPAALTSDEAWALLDAYEHGALHVDTPAGVHFVYLSSAQVNELHKILEVA